MIDWFVILTPLAVLLIMLLFRFIGCDGVFGLSHLYGLSLEWGGTIRDRVGQGSLALAPDGANDGTLTVTVQLSSGRTITALQLRSFPAGSSSPSGVWDTDSTTIYWALGVSATLDGPLLNDPLTAAVHFPVAEDDAFVIFASDQQGMEFLPGNTLSLIATFTDFSTESATVVIPSMT